MRTKTKILALAVMASVAVPATAVGPDGNYSMTYSVLVASDWSFKDGTGVYEPGGPGSPCPGLILLGLRTAQPISHYYQTLRMATNVKGVAGETGVHIPGIAPIPIAPCPLPVVPPMNNIEIWFNGLNLRLLDDAMTSELNLCSQLIQSSSGGCIPDPATVDLDVAACPFANAAFGHLTADGKPDFGVWDVIGGQIGATIWSESIACGGSGYSHAHDYTAAVGNFGVNYASTGQIPIDYRTDVPEDGNHLPQFGLSSRMGDNDIQNADIVHPGSGDQYAVICWTLSYVNLDGDTPAGTLAAARAHDYQLIWDVNAAPAVHQASLLAHLGGPTELLRGLYSTVPGAGAGNGSPCPEGTLPEDKKGDLMVIDPL